MQDFEERRACLATSGVFRLSDYLLDVVQPLWVLLGAGSSHAEGRRHARGTFPASPVPCRVAQGRDRREPSSGRGDPARRSLSGATASRSAPDLRRSSTTGYFGCTSIAYASV